MRTAILFTVLLGFVSCGPIAFWNKQSSPHEHELELIRSRLLNSIDSLLTVNRSHDPARHDSLRLVFEQNLTTYLARTGQERSDLIHVQHRGATILLPVRRTDSPDGMKEVVYGDTAVVLWRPLSPAFTGEILDITPVLDRERKESSIAVLFADSIVAVSLEDGAARSSVYRFTEELPPLVRSQFPTGMLFVDPSESTGAVRFVTSHIDSPKVLYLHDGIIETRTDGFFGKFMPVHGRPFLHHDELDPHILYGMRRLPDSAGYVLLDEHGYLHRFDPKGENRLWRTDVPVGNRLFVAGEDTIAIVAQGEQFFRFYRMTPDSLVALGTSPEFNGPVTAVSPADVDEQSGWLVGVTEYEKRGHPYGRVYFIAAQHVHWRHPDTDLPPSFPDYDTNFLFVDGLGPIFDDQHFERNLPPALWHSLFESLVRYDAKDELVLQLAESISSSASHTEWLIRLRPDIYFADGTNMTSRHVIDAWELNHRRCRQEQCDRLWLSEIIDTVSIVDTYSLRVNLSASRPNFPEHLASSCFHIAKHAGSESVSVGTGPFVLIATEQRGTFSRFTCRRNSYYRGGQPPLSEYIVQVRDDVVIDLVDGTAHAGGIIRRPEQIDYFRAIANITYIPGGEKITYFLALNPSRSSLNSLAARRRIAALIERDAMVAVVTEARSEPAFSFFADHRTPGTESEAPGTVRFTENLRMYYRQNDPVAEQIVQRLAIRLTQVGIPVQRPAGLSADRFRQVRKDGRYDILVDSMLPMFSSRQYTLYDLLQRGYVFDTTIADMLHTFLERPAGGDVSVIEDRLFDQGYLYPLIRTPLYIVLPRSMRNIQLAKPYVLDVSKSWFPRVP
jgi:MarR-like DNA-binding transcriptional regulator SgrR of sgrS sRNA